MGRAILAAVGGLVAWTMIVTIIDLGLRHALPGYHAAEGTLAFTGTMKAARLIMAAITSLAAGAATRLIAPRSDVAPWLVGAVLLILFLPAHIRIWDKLPVWYHLTFLLTLAPLVALGGVMVRRGRTGALIA